MIFHGRQRGRGLTAEHAEITEDRGWREEEMTADLRKLRIVLKGIVLNPTNGEKTERQSYRVTDDRT